MPTLPSEIIAVHLHEIPAKRKQCRLVRFGSRYIVQPPAPVPSLSSLELAPGTLITFDCPIGLPRTYAHAAGLRSFRDALKTFGRGRFQWFYETADVTEQISLHRPFYPTIARDVSQQRMREILGDAATALRQCEMAVKASPLFWLVGPQQRGKVTIQAWRDVLAPRIDSIALWPYDGPLDELLSSGSPVVAEVHPGWLLRTLGLGLINEQSQSARAGIGLQLFERTKDVDLQAVRRLLLDGFGSSPQGEDDFDVTVSAIALARLLQQDRLPEPPDQALLVEGWMLGLPPPEAR